MAKIKKGKQKEDSPPKEPPKPPSPSSSPNPPAPPPPPAIPLQAQETIQVKKEQRQQENIQVLAPGQPVQKEEANHSEMNQNQMRPDSGADYDDGGWGANREASEGEYSGEEEYDDGSWGGAVQGQSQAPPAQQTGAAHDRQSAGPPPAAAQHLTSDQGPQQWAPSPNSYAPPLAGNQPPAANQWKSTLGTAAAQKPTADQAHQGISRASVAAQQWGASHTMSSPQQWGVNLPPTGPQQWGAPMSRDSLAVTQGAGGGYRPPPTGAASAWKSWGKPSGGDQQRPPGNHPKPVDVGSQRHSKARDSGWGQQSKPKESSRSQRRDGDGGWGYGGEDGWSQPQGRDDGWGQTQGRDDGWGQQTASDGWGQQKGTEARWEQPKHTSSQHKGWEDAHNDGDSDTELGSDDSGWEGNGGEWDQENNDWDAPHSQTHQGRPGWAAWGAEAKQLPKVNHPHAGDAGTRNVVSPLERSQIMNEILNMQVQSRGSHAAHATPTHQSQQQQKHKLQKQDPVEKKDKKHRSKDQRHDRHQSHHYDGWGDEEDGGWAGVDQEEWGDSRKVRFSPILAPDKDARQLWGGSASEADTSYSMPSKTFAHASKGMVSTGVYSGIPRSKTNEYPDVKFVESYRKALEPVQKALFGNDRLARDRIYWTFPPDKDERVAALFTWIQTMSYNLAAFGLHKFLQSRERGALMVNAEFRTAKKPNEPAFDWLTFDDLQLSMDRTLQESAAFYNPSMQVIVFVFLPSKSGNSVAIWRRKLHVPNNVRLMLQGEISLAIAGLRKEKDYLIHVDELPNASKHISAVGDLLPPSPKVKKRKWWKFFG